MSWLDQASDGRILHWGPHFLTEVARMLGHDHLLDEPSFKAPSDVEGRLLQLEPLPGGLRLRTNGWKELQVAVFPRSLSARPEDRWRRWRPMPSSLSWRDLPLGGAYELTPRDAHGESAGTRAFLRPPEVPWLRFELRFRYGVALNRVEVRPESGEDISPFDRITLAALRKVNGRLERVGEPLDLPRGEGSWTCAHHFQGFLAVVGARNGQRYLLDCRNLHDAAQRSRDPEEWSSLCQALGCGSGGGPFWPEASQERLATLQKAVADAGIPGNAVPAYPRGALRFLVLRECAELIWPGEEPLRTLDAEPSFERVLEGLFPQVFPSLARAKDPRVRLWLLRNARRPGVEQIVGWVSRLDESTLKRAADLFPLRQRVQDLLLKVREDCPLGQRAKGLLDKIDRALRSGEPLEEAAGEISGLERELAEERSRPLGPDQPPADRERFAVWQRNRERSQAWRRQVDRILRLCESGDGAAAPASEAPSIGDLASRTGSLTLDFPLDSPDDPATTVLLRDLVAEALGHVSDEPPSEPRERTVGHLARHVQPCPERWSALHAVLRRAGANVGTWPQLAAALDLSAGGREGAARANLFLKLIAELPAELARWGGVSPGPDGTVALGGLLTTPEHPWISKAHAEAVQLRERLDRAPSLPSLSQTPPLRTPGLSFEGFLAWWQELRELDTALSDLRYQARDLELQVDRALKLLRTLLAKAPDRREDFAHWLDREPATFTYREFAELRRAISEIERIHG